MTTLAIARVWRSDDDGEREELEFYPGVNVLVGEPNTGKSSWLRTINYLFGSAKPPEHVMGDQIAESFSQAGMTLMIEGKPYEVERGWRRRGTGNVLVDGNSLQAEQFTEMLMELLDIPLTHYPKGSPLSAYTWPLVGFRSLLRHMYRHENSWGALVAEQPEAEQHACLLQFLGVADDVFSAEYEELFGRTKERARLEARKEQFVEVLSAVTREIASVADPALVPTRDSIRTVLERLRARRAMLESEGLRTEVDETDDTAESADEIAALGQRRAELQEQLANNRGQLRSTDARANQVGSEQLRLKGAISRLKRAVASGTALAGLRVTHCPACLEPIETTSNAQACFLCGKDHRISPDDHRGYEDRVAFEVQQLQNEYNENEELIASLLKRCSEIQEDILQVRSELGDVQARLETMRTATIAPRLSEDRRLDQEIGRLSEQIRQVDSVERLLETRDKLSQDIDALTHEIASLDEVARSKLVAVDFETLSDQLSDAMQTYLGLLQEPGVRRWTVDAPVTLNVTRSSFRITVGTSGWSSRLGGTLRLYLLLAYQYALMTLTARESANYPGFAMLDFPPSFIDEGRDVQRADYETHAVRPFVRMIEDVAQGQLIVAGRAFAGLEGVHRVPLTEVH